MNKDNILTEIEQYTFFLFEAEPTGHDYYHMKRVAKTAKKLAVLENADPFIAEAAGWLHDVGDAKLFDEPEQVKKDLKDFLIRLPLPHGEAERIHRAMEAVSFKSGHQVPPTLEGKIVQDADRLDALGAIGIARTFAFGGAKGQMIHLEDDTLTSVRHFYDKLFKIKDLMNTETAKHLADKRQQRMEDFLEAFYQEWNMEA